MMSIMQVTARQDCLYPAQCWDQDSNRDRDRDRDRVRDRVRDRRALHRLSLSVT